MEEEEEEEEEEEADLLGALSGASSKTAKLLFVDLAGSERVRRTSSRGHTHTHTRADGDTFFEEEEDSRHTPGPLSRTPALSLSLGAD